MQVGTSTITAANVNGAADAKGGMSLTIIVINVTNVLGVQNGPNTRNVVSTRNVVRPGDILNMQDGPSLTMNVNHDAKGGTSSMMDVMNVIGALDVQNGPSTRNVVNAGDVLIILNVQDGGAINAANVLYTFKNLLFLYCLQVGYLRLSIYMSFVNFCPDLVPVHEPLPLMRGPTLSPTPSSIIIN